jgi:hypothetical protein
MTPTAGTPLVASSVAMRSASSRVPLEFRTIVHALLPEGQVARSARLAGEASGAGVALGVGAAADPPGGGGFWGGVGV